MYAEIMTYGTSKSAYKIHLCVHYLQATFIYTKEKKKDIDVRVVDIAWLSQDILCEINVLGIFFVCISSTAVYNKSQISSQRQAVAASLLFRVKY